MAGFVVDAQTGRRPRGRKGIDGHPRQDLVVGPRVGVGPIVELLVDPGEQADGGVGEGVAEGLGFGALFDAVAAAFLEEPFGAGEAGVVAGAVRGEGVLEGEEWVGGPGWGGGARHVYVGGEAVVRVEEAHDAGYHGAPVAALGYCGGRCECFSWRREGFGREGPGGWRKGKTG